jgi:hypothetical protein
LIFLKQFIFLFIFIAPLSAEVYQCDEDGITHFSNSPCDSQVFDLEVENSSVDEELYQQEQFVIPSYPGWKHGWQKTTDVKLSRFSEIVYKPLQPTTSTKNMVITQQKMTDLPESMTAQRFAVSVQDIVESICKSSIHYPVNTGQSDKVFYGHYACTQRRDTKKGELGYYKIMRGENSLYMIAIKWEVDTFIIGRNQFVPALESGDNEQKLLTAKRYLQNDVKLCQLGDCL